MRTLTVILLCLLATVSTAFAAGLEVTLTGGDVTGDVRGQGTASVEALAVNTGSSEVTGVRIAVYYSTQDLEPANPDTADWRIHEFIFEPPLQPGKSTKLMFTDEDAAEYVLIEVRYVASGLSLSYNGTPATLDYPMEFQGGVHYIATRDLVNLVGGSLGYDNSTYEVTLNRAGIELRFKGGSVKINGHNVGLQNPVIEVDGRTFVPLKEFCRHLDIGVTHSTGTNQIILSGE